ncbi:MAG: hypothetical protein KGO49_12920 [Gammaproteobacteria bacterium]|nr:hypothetical protein [Gammaproteobacteria bacterium]
MKKLALLSILCTPLIATHVWADTDGKSAPTAPASTPAKTVASSLTAHIVIVPGDGQDVRKNWNGVKPKVTDTVSQGSAISILIAFSDCAPNTKGLCDVSVEFFVVSPDGVKKPGGSGAVWSGVPFSIPNVSLLGQASLTAGFDKTDPVGDYKVLANVTDKVSGKVLHLSQNFKVTK